MNSAEIQDRLLGFINEELAPPGSSVSIDEDLLSGELFDSIAVVRLGSYIEEEFDCQIPPADFVVENFESVAAITRYLKGLLGGP